MLNYSNRHNIVLILSNKVHEMAKTIAPKLGVTVNGNREIHTNTMVKQSEIVGLNNYNLNC